MAWHMGRLEAGKEHCVAGELSERAVFDCQFILPHVFLWRQILLLLQAGMAL